MSLSQLNTSRVRQLSFFLLALSCWPPALPAQEKPLGDVAREARAKKADSFPGKKLITNDDFGPHLDPVTPGEDPLAAYSKASAALLSDGRHSCLREASHSNYPGSLDTRLTEVAGPDRFHVVITMSQGQGSEGPGEYIIVGSDVYRRRIRAAWEKLAPAEASFVRKYRFDFPDVLQFAYQPGDLKLIGQENTSGAPAFHYQYKVHVVDMDRKVDIWLRASDHLPLKTHMVTVTTDALGPPISWQESASCTYGQTFRIEAPQ